MVLKDLALSKLLCFNGDGYDHLSQSGTTWSKIIQEWLPPAKIFLMFLFPKLFTKVKDVLDSLSPSPS